MRDAMSRKSGRDPAARPSPQGTRRNAGGSGLLRRLVAIGDQGEDEVSHHGDQGHHDSDDHAAGVVGGGIHKGGPAEYAQSADAVMMMRARPSYLLAMIRPSFFWIFYKPNAL